MVGNERILQALRATSLPPAVIEALVSEAPPLWLMSESSAELLASDLVLCHPDLVPGEVRVRAVPVDYVGAWRLTLVAADRRGLLADTAAVLADRRLSIYSASALTLGARGIAMHSLTVRGRDLEESSWESLSHHLQEAARDGAPQVCFYPCGAAEVTSTGAPGGRSLLTVVAPDQLGLLGAICRALADQGVSIEVAKVASNGPSAHDVFVVQGEVDVSNLAARLSRVGRSSLAQLLVELPGKVPLVGGLLRRGIEAII